MNKPMLATEHERQIEDAKINFSAIWNISDEIFTKKAAETLNVPIERVQVGRCTMMHNFGKLTVYVYKEDDKEKMYYRLENGSTQYRFLSPNIHEFEKQLKEGYGKLT